MDLADLRHFRTSTSLDAVRRRGPWVHQDLWRPARPRILSQRRKYRCGSIPASCRRRRTRRLSKEYGRRSVGYGCLTIESERDGWSATYSAHSRASGNPALGPRLRGDERKMGNAAPQRQSVRDAARGSKLLLSFPHPVRLRRPECRLQRGPIRRALIDGCGVWVPGLADARPGRQENQLGKILGVGRSPPDSGDVAPAELPAFCL